MTVIDNLTRWINSSGLFEEEGENKGGVHSYFDQNNLEFGFLYPEITGYFINSQRFLYKITNDKKLIDNALASAEWLIKIFEKYGGIIQGINTDSSRGKLAYSFDTAVCANAFLDCYALSKNDRYLNFAKLLSKWIINDGLESDGTLKPYKNLDLDNFEESKDLWYKQKGCFHIKTSIPLIKLYKITNEEKYLKKSELICSTYDNYKKPDGSLTLHSNNDVIHLHSLCYALEGLLHCYSVTKNEQYLTNCLECLNWCQNKINDDGSIELWYKSGYEHAKTSYHVAQLIRIMILVDLAKNSNNYNDSINKLSSFLVTLQAKNDDMRVDGGFYEEYYKTLFGWKLRKRVNSWGSFFALQAEHWKNKKNSLSFENEIEFLF